MTSARETQVRQNPIWGVWSTGEKLSREDIRAARTGATLTLTGVNMPSYYATKEENTFCNLELVRGGIPGIIEPQSPDSALAWLVQHADGGLVKSHIITVPVKKLRLKPLDEVKAICDECQKHDDSCTSRITTAPSYEPGL